MPDRKSQVLPLLGAAAVLVLLAGCTAERVTSPSSTQVLSQQAADTLGNVVASDVDGMADTDNPDAVPDMSMSAAEAVNGMPSSCRPTRSPAVPANADKDGVPDDVLFTFNCTVSKPLVTLTTTGTIEVKDPTPTIADLSAQHIFTDFFRGRTNVASGHTYSLKFNGTRTRTGDASALDFAETDFRTDFVYENGTTGSHTRSWQSHFLADVPGSITAGASLPSGTRTLQGTSTWTHGTVSHSISVTTTTPLHYNATCTQAPRFDAGELALTVTTRTGATSNLTVTFGPACGQVTVVRQ